MSRIRLPTAIVSTLRRSYDFEVHKCVRLCLTLKHAPNRSDHTRCKKSANHQKLRWQFICSPHVCARRNCSAIEKALKIDNKDPLALGHAGMHQLFLGNHDQSIAFAKQAVVEAPGMDSPYYSLGWFQMFNETPEEGIENLKRAMRLSPIVTAPRSAILGTAYRNAGQLDLAVATLENTVERFPGFISGRVALTSCYVLMGKEQEAEQEAREILRRDPAYSIARYTTPNLYRNTETMEKWADSLRKAGIPD